VLPAFRDTPSRTVRKESGRPSSAVAFWWAIIGALQGWKAAMPDVKGTVTSAAESGQRVVLEVTWEGTQTGEMVTEQGTIPPSGKRQKTPSAFIFDYENGKLKESRHYFDMLNFLKQIGAA
jgi:steroid delta-isomerase-like uncharacterized protein